jgi:hypothetical protein
VIPKPASSEPASASVDAVLIATILRATPGSTDRKRCGS